MYTSSRRMGALFQNSYPSPQLSTETVELRHPLPSARRVFGELLHLVGKGFVVILNRFCADITAGGEHMAMLGNFLEQRCGRTAGLGVGRAAGFPGAPRHARRRRCWQCTRSASVSSICTPLTLVPSCGHPQTALRPCERFYRKPLLRFRPLHHPLAVCSVLRRNHRQADSGY